MWPLFAAFLITLGIGSLIRLYWYDLLTLLEKLTEDKQNDSDTYIATYHYQPMRKRENLEDDY